MGESERFVAQAQTFSNPVEREGGGVPACFLVLGAHAQPLLEVLPLPP